MEIDDGAWARLGEAQEGVVTRAQAFACGWNAGAVEHRLGSAWQRLLPAVYLLQTGRPTWEQKAWAALLFAGHDLGRPVGLTAESGLVRVRLAQPAPDVHVAVQHAHRRREARFFVGEGRVVLHRTTRGIEPHGTLPVLPVARCVVDACLGAPIRDTRALVSSAVQQGRTTVPLLLAELEEAPQQGSGALRRALSEVGEGARSAPEATLARALRAVSLPPYRLNADVFDEHGTWLARGDVVLEELKLLVEVDGERWHLSAERWTSDVARHTRLEAAGWTVLRYPASRVLRDTAGVVAQIRAVATRLAQRAA